MLVTRCWPAVLTDEMGRSFLLNNTRRNPCKTRSEGQRLYTVYVMLNLNDERGDKTT